MNLLSNIFGRQHISPDAKILSPGERMNQRVLCPHCEKDMEGHDGVACARKGVSRRVFLGLFGASAAALALRTEGTPFPLARVQVRALAGDMFEVETLNPFTLAWSAPKGKPFRSDDGVLSEGGILEFHGQDVSRPDKWLRVHRGLPEMEVLGLVDKVTGQAVKYKIVRSAEADQRVGLAEKRVMQEHYAAGRASLLLKRDIEDSISRDIRLAAAWRERERVDQVKAQEKERRLQVRNRFTPNWRSHESVNRLSRGWPLARPKGTLPA